MSSDAKPLVSVIIPLYNQARYVAEAVDSVFAQDYLPLQVIVIDDGSVDEAPRVLAELAAKYPSLQVIRQENAGVCRACNTALERVRGQYVIRLDADDTLPPNYVSALAQALHGAEGTVAYSYCDARYFEGEQGVYPGRPYDFAQLICEQYIHVSALLLTSVAREVGYFNPNLIHGCEDWDLWLTVGERGYRGVYCRETALNYRIKLGCPSRHHMNPAQYREMHRRIRANHPAIYRNPVNRLRVFFARVGRRLRHHFRLG